MTDSEKENLGDKKALFCSVCEEERVFVWAAWSCVEFYGYPPEQEYGWKCSVCGSKVHVS